MAYFPHHDEWPKRIIHLCTLYRKSKWQKSISDAEHMDIVQHVCEAAVKKFQRAAYNPSKGFTDSDHFLAWAKHVYGNKARDILRARKRQLAKSLILRRETSALWDPSHRSHKRPNPLDAFHESSQGMALVLEFITWVGRSDPIAGRMLRLIFELDLPPPKYLNHSKFSNADFAEILGVTENYIKDVQRGVSYLCDNPSVLVSAVQSDRIQFRPFKHQRN